MKLRYGRHTKQWLDIGKFVKIDTNINDICMINEYIVYFKN